MILSEKIQDRTNTHKIHNKKMEDNIKEYARNKRE